MADTRATVLVTVPTGLTTSYTSGIVAGTTDFVVKNNGAMRIHCKKSGAGSCTVTIKTPAKFGGLDVAEQTGTVPATTGDLIFGPFPGSLYNDANGDLRFNFSEVTGLTFMCFI